MLSNIEITTCTYQYDNSLSALLSTLAPDIERAALALARRVFSLTLDVDDLKQEANTAIIEASSRFDVTKVKDNRSVHSWYMKRARGAMVNHIRALFARQGQDKSLDAWQEANTKEGTMHREIAATEPPARLATLSERRRILAALRSLTAIERAVMLAAYGIEDERGRVYSPGDVCARLGITPSAYRSAKNRAIKRLARTFNQ